MQGMDHNNRNEYSRQPRPKKFRQGPPGSTHLIHSPMPPYLQGGHGRPFLPGLLFTWGRAKADAAKHFQLQKEA